MPARAVVRQLRLLVARSIDFLIDVCPVKVSMNRDNTSERSIEGLENVLLGF